MDRYQLLPALDRSQGRPVKLRSQFIGGGLVMAEVVTAKPTEYWHVAVVERGGDVIFTKRPVCRSYVVDQVRLFGVADDALWTVEPVVPAVRNPWDCPPPPARRATRTQDVYFMQAATGGPIKIGCSDSPETRLTQLQTGCPFKLQIIGVIPAAGRKVEAQLHAHFAAIRSHGEWYEPTRELAAYIAPWRV